VRPPGLPDQSNDQDEGVGDGPDVHSTGRVSLQRCGVRRTWTVARGNPTLAASVKDVPDRDCNHTRTRKAALQGERQGLKADRSALAWCMVGMVYTDFEDRTGPCSRSCRACLVDQSVTWLSTEKNTAGSLSRTKRGTEIQPPFAHILSPLLLRRVKRVKH
jgi:hypothetical protein